MPHLNEDVKHTEGNAAIHLYVKMKFSNTDIEGKEITIIHFFNMVVAVFLVKLCYPMNKN